MGDIHEHASSECGTISNKKKVTFALPRPRPTTQRKKPPKPKKQTGLTTAGRQGPRHASRAGPPRPRQGRLVLAEVADPEAAQGQGEKKHSDFPARACPQRARVFS